MYGRGLLKRVYRERIRSPDSLGSCPGLAPARLVMAIGDDVAYVATRLPLTTVLLAQATGPRARGRVRRP
jgi:hypothetical protein